MEPSSVAIVGGGPVGLLLGCRLAQCAVPSVVFERDASASASSRAIGIHPPGLRRMDALGILPRLVRAGVVIEAAQAWSKRRQLGRLDLTQRPGPYRFSLSVPQFTTEQLLAERLEELAPGRLRRGTTVTNVELRPNEARLTVVARDGRKELHRARAVVGCDGRNGVVRQAMEVTMPGRSHPETFLMADVRDDTPFGPEPAIFLTDTGLVESFPLPGGMRRWVAETEVRNLDADVEALATRVERRTGHVMATETATMESAFGIEQRAATRLVQGPAILAGDAAHVVSPIGAQGMNLGWVGAWRVAGALSRPDREAALADYDRQQRLDARRAMRRAALFGWVGRRPRCPWLRRQLVRLSLATIPDALLAGAFTMAPLG